MKQQWDRLAARFQAFGLRERAWISVMLTVVVLTLVYILTLEPPLKRHKKLQGQMAEQNQLLKTAEEQVQALQTRLQNPDAQLHEQLKKLRADIAVVDTRLHALEQTLVAPADMASLLEQILRRNPRLQLVEVRKLPVAALVASAVDKAQAKDGRKDIPAQDVSTKGVAGIYKHGVEITVQGMYGDLFDYLTQLEHLPQQLFWGEIRLTTEKYPNNRMTIIVYTLSLDKAWLTV